MPSTATAPVVPTPALVRAKCLPFYRTVAQGVTFTPASR